MYNKELEKTFEIKEFVFEVSQVNIILWRRKGNRINTIVLGE